MSKSALLHAKELFDNETANLCHSLCGKTIKELHAIAKNVYVRLTGSSRKTNITDQLIVMAWIGANKSEMIDDDTGKDITEISYITEEVKHAVRKLPPPESVTDWQKYFRGVLMDFTLMNLIYLVTIEISPLICTHSRLLNP